MDKRVTWGILIIFMSLFYIFQQHIPENILKYVFNYQMILMIIGIFFVFNKSKFGWAVVAIGLYLYFKEFFGDYFDIGFPIVALIGGIILLSLGIYEKNKLKNNGKKKEKAIYKSSTKDKSQVDKVKDKIEEAEEIK